ncbi:MAG: UDP-N-acetyl glucosamine 2-epimerase [Gemmatimonadales bacterium]
MLLEVLRRRWQVIAIDTGQHYDFELNGLFYQQLEIPRPDHFLEVGSDSPASQTAAVLARTAEILRDERPAAVVVIGDTNSTLGAALAASKEGYPLVHVEAGLRSNEPNLPEETNRRVVDVLGQLLCAPSAAAAAQLRAELSPGTVVNTGDVARDVLLRHVAIAPPPESGPPFALATFHRAALTGDRDALAALIDALASLDLPILLPLHPRTRGALESYDLLRRLPAAVEVRVPLGYLETVAAVRDAAVVITDSGGLQREAYWMGTPCITIRGETEWTETVACGANALIPPLDAPRLLADAVATQRRNGRVAPWARDAYGEGQAAMRIADAIGELLGRDGA